MKKAVKLMIQRHLLDKPSESLKLPMMPLDDFAEVLFELGFNTMVEEPYKKTTVGEIDYQTNMDEFSTNGWQIDFWWKFKHKELGNYMLSGSLWYGEFQLTFIKSK